MERINLLTTPSLGETRQIKPSNQSGDGANFATLFKNALDNINKMEHETNMKRELLTLGKIDDLHDVMITAQKTAITIETAVQIQQKVIDTYNEVMRMQI